MPIISREKLDELFRSGKATMDQPGRMQAPQSPPQDNRKMKPKRWEESPRLKLLAIPLFVLVVAAVVALMWWQTTPGFKSMKHRDDLALRLAALMLEKEKTLLKKVELEADLIFINKELDKVYEEISGDENPAEILSNADRIMRADRD
jgi:hypothetical protein